MARHGDRRVIRGAAALALVAAALLSLAACHPQEPPVRLDGLAPMPRALPIGRS